jgi:hypothetical protein
MTNERMTEKTPSSGNYSEIYYMLNCSKNSLKIIWCDHIMKVIMTFERRNRDGKYKC